MKSRIVLLFMSLPVLFNSCATIVGGSKYKAHVVVENSPNAQIVFKNIPQGYGAATFLVNRTEANQFSITVKSEGCDAQMFSFNARTFRGWSLVGSLVTYTFFPTTTKTKTDYGYGGYSNTYTYKQVIPIPIPLGVIVDLASGAYWKPSVKEKGVTQESYK